MHSFLLRILNIKQMVKSVAYLHKWTILSYKICNVSIYRCVLYWYFKIAQADIAC